MKQLSLRRRVFEVVEGGSRRAALSRIFSAALIILILVNVIAAIFETVPTMTQTYFQVFAGVEGVSLTVFAIEYVVRLWVCVEHPRARGVPAWRARLNYVFTPSAIIDFIAIVPFFIVALGGADIRTMVLVRLMRLFKLGRYSTGFQSLFEAVRRERHALVASFLVLTSIVLVAASLAYIAEREAQPDDFGSIPQAIWWAIETVTTVGYGDVIPKTLAGHIIGGITMITGILMIALPIAIIGSSFAEVIRQRSFVVTFGLVVRMPMFASLSSDVLHDLLPMLRAMTVEAGTAIVEPGEGDDALYGIAEGVVELDSDGGRRRLSVGDSFGASPDITDKTRADPALALTRVKLLAIDRIDLIHLVARYPGLAGRLKPNVQAGIVMDDGSGGNPA
ncbi:cyclic nucleotide-gated ion channel [Bauldia litoralis]|uniref:cyclic nucleotide-gated ion channel n=1 Tax=Bauldia litoralis TaxID=665467 RepID=UPI003263F06A